jgi:hypothetical protein
MEFLGLKDGQVTDLFFLAFSTEQSSTAKQDFSLSLFLLCIQ